MHVPTTEKDKSIPETLNQTWQEMRANNPHLRIRETAAALGVSEAELLATACGNSATRLVADWPGLLGELVALGPLMALTRNDFAVHEKAGLYSRLSLYGKQLLITGHNINLCLLLQHWHAGFAVTEDTPTGPRHSLQFFAEDGEAVHKIYLIGHERLLHYQKLIDAFQNDDQSPGLRLPTPSPSPILNSGSFADGLPDIWQRLPARNLRSGEQSPVATTAAITDVSQFRQLMHQLVQMMLPLEITVHSKGAIQVHEGPIRNLRITGPWFNVLDEGFNLHLNETAVERMEVVSIPYRHTALSGLLLFDEHGRTIVSIFGQYDEVIGENPLWRDFMAVLPTPLSNGQV